MNEKTTSYQFEKYGFIYEEVKEIDRENLISKNIVTCDTVISSLYNFLEPVYIEIVDGMAAILISDVKNGEFKLFNIHRHLEIKPNMYFNIIPMVDKVTFNLIIPKNYNLKLEFLDTPYVYNKIQSTINIPKIIACYYSIKSPNYKFKGESHNIYELTFVDNGFLDTTVDGVEYKLEAYDLIIYGKNKFHTQQVSGDSSCSYLTIIFEMACKDMDIICNRIFHCRKELYIVLKNFSENISSDIPYSKNLVLNNLHEILIRLLQYDYLNVEKSKLPKESYQHFQNQLLENILSYIENMICEPITVEDICNKFAISRSSLQTLFKNNINTTPKKYISVLKLAKSKLIIKENKYTISEIAFMLGFSSIHYFSRAFTQHFDISPSEYAQKVFK
ncbi:MAG: helix-turn-helix transcriptional regulator [Terrisporobacter sp.]